MSFILFNAVPLYIQLCSSPVQLDKAFTASVESKICPLTIAVFLKFYSDPIILDLCQDIFKSLTQNPDCIGPLQTRLIPTLTSMMAVTPRDKSKDGKHPSLSSKNLCL